MKLQDLFESNLAINWKPASPSDKAYLKRIGLEGDKIEMASVEVDDGDEIDYAKIDGKRYRIDYDKDTFVAEGLTEAKGEYSSFASWKAAIKKKYPDAWIDGDKDIASAMVGPKPYKHGETKGVGEWDGAKGELYESKVHADHFGDWKKSAWKLADAEQKKHFAHHDQDDEIQILSGKKTVAKWDPRKKAGWILETR